MYCSIRDWMLSDRLKLDDDKTEFIITGQQLAKVNIDSLPVSDSTTTPVSEVKNLGTWFDRQLKWRHIKNICIICKASFSTYITKDELGSSSVLIVLIFWSEHL